MKPLIRNPQSAIRNRPGTVPLAESHRYCAELARREARNFYYSFMVMPREKRRAFCAVYAFLRRSDDISDDVARTADCSERARQLGQWNQRLAAALDGDYGDSPLLPAFHDTVRRYGIPARYFFELIEGARMDLSPVRFATFEDLYLYCYRVAGTVGLISLHIFGFEPENAGETLRRAEACGIAFQLTNILRDLREDAGLGRVYLPEEDLHRFAYTREELTAGRGGDAYQALMRFEAERAAGYYREAFPLLELISPDCRPALWAMITLYGSILGRMRASGYPMLRRRVELSTMEKLHIAARASWMRLAGATSVPSPEPALG